MLVKKHLDDLQDGVQLLKLYDAELTDDAIRAVADARDVLDHQIAQLADARRSMRRGRAQAASASTEQLEAERPWREIGALDADLEICATATSPSGSGCSSGRSSRRRRHAAG